MAYSMHMNKMYTANNSHNMHWSLCY